MPDIDLDLDDLEKRLAGLPAGPWRIKVEREVDTGWVVCVKHRGPAGTGECICPHHKPNDVFPFLADARGLVEALLARVRLAEGLVADGRLDVATLIAIEREQAFNAGYQVGQEEMTQSKE